MIIDAKYTGPNRTRGNPKLKLQGLANRLKAKLKQKAKAKK